jgi:hypothetical protein
VETMIQEGQESGIINPNLSKHTSSLAQMHKVKLRLQEVDDNRPKPANHLTDQEHASGQTFLADLRKSGQAEAMVESARSFLSMVTAEEGVELEVDQCGNPIKESL